MPPANGQATSPATSDAELARVPTEWNEKDVPIALKSKPIIYDDQS